MLTHLQIRDFAIIDSVELELRRGLTVLTGETGAGKSILVDALQLLAGGRAGAEVVRHGAERAEVSGTFDLAEAPPELRQWLEEQSVSGAGELTVRRVVGADGRSRGYLNGQTVPVQLLREAGNILVDIHGQHEFQSLTRSAAQRALLDGYGCLTGLTTQLGIAHRVWLELLNRTLELESKARDRDTRLELLRYQAQELQALQLKAGEIDSLGEERARLANRGRLAQGAHTALAELYENEAASAHAGVSRALQALRGLAALDGKLALVLPMLEEASIQVREAARELERYRETLDVDAARQDEVERRLAAIEELSRKHRVAPPELPARARQPGLGGRAGAPVARGAGVVRGGSDALHGIRRSRRRHRRRGGGDRRPRVARAWRTRPGAVRDASAAGRLPGAPSCAGHQAHRRTQHAHHGQRAQRQGSRRGAGAHAGRHRGERQGARARPRDAARRHPGAGQSGARGSRPRPARLRGDDPGGYAARCGAVRRGRDRASAAAAGRPGPLAALAAVAEGAVRALAAPIKNQ